MVYSENMILHWYKKHSVTFRILVVKPQPLPAINAQMKKKTTVVEKQLYKRTVYKTLCNTNNILQANPLCYS